MIHEGIGFDFFFLEEGFLITELLEFLNIPHYTNKIRGPPCLMEELVDFYNV